MQSNEANPEVKEDQDQIVEEAKKENNTTWAKEVNEEEANELWTKIKNIGQLDPNTSSNWGGSIIFLRRYVNQALERIQQGPKKLIDPYNEFLE